MPNLGETRRGAEIGYANRTCRFIWHACVDCDKERWVRLLFNKPAYNYCKPCGCKVRSGKMSGENSPHWKGGRDKNGYITLYLSPKDPFHSMCSTGNRIFEHRLVMAKHLGRCLLKSEQVHHKNGIRDDNRKENLELISQANHLLYKRMCSECPLRKEIRLLTWQMKELREQLQGRLIP